MIECCFLKPLTKDTAWASWAKGQLFTKGAIKTRVCFTESGQGKKVFDGVFILVLYIN